MCLYAWAYFGNRFRDLAPYFAPRCRLDRAIRNNQIIHSRFCERGKRRFDLALQKISFCGAFRHHLTHDDTDAGRSRGGRPSSQGKIRRPCRSAAAKRKFFSRKADIPFEHRKTAKPSAFYGLSPAYGREPSGRSRNACARGSRESGDASFFLGYR